ncbi:8977_t:CDS:2, partial [Funneliformis geosporum]
CSSSPLITQKAKKQNTIQTVDIPPTQQNTETPEPVVSMELDPSPSKKGKEKETLEDTPENTTTTLDIDAFLMRRRTSWTKDIDRTDGTFGTYMRHSCDL